MRKALFIFCAAASGLYTLLALGQVILVVIVLLYDPINAPEITSIVVAVGFLCMGGLITAACIRELRREPPSHTQ